ncbi:MAG: RNA methyltransferase [Syntrophobacteria bacterium]
MTFNCYLDQFSIVLHRPRLPENIGAAARAGRNMGIRRLVLVDPEDCDLSRICKMSTHCAVDVVENMEIYSDLATALHPFHYVVATTARTKGAQRQQVKTPREMAAELASISTNNRVALLFGPENRGLSNADLRLCHALVTIPTAGFSSVNLAQSVMIICYEVMMAGRQPAGRFVPRLANRRELEAMYEHLKETLIKISFINRENPDYWMLNIRRFFSRIELQAREVQIIRGICRQIDWYTQKRLDKLQDRSRE